jgi:hypothetical protein
MIYGMWGKIPDALREAPIMNIHNKGRRKTFSLKWSSEYEM